jgi:N-acetylneuraminate 9-O-acetyltransferase
LAFIADRTHFVFKHQKEFSLIEFGGLVALIVVVSLLTLKKSEVSGILHRDITDEWKGWMQLLILVYHYTGASSVSPIYNGKLLMNEDLLKHCV